MTKNKSRIENIQAKIKETQKDIRNTKRHIQACEESLDNLNEELEALLIQVLPQKKWKLRNYALETT